MSLPAHQQQVDRFLRYPGVSKLANHPKLIAVKNDPVVSELLLSQSYIKLLRHEKVLALSNDEEFNGLIRKMEFEKALDHAIAPDASPPTRAAAPEKVQ